MTQPATLPTNHPISRALEHAEQRHRLASIYGPHAQASTAAQIRRAKLAYDATLALHPPGILGMPLPALPRPPLPNAAAIRVLIEAEIAASWVRVGSKKIPYDAPGPSLMERAWKRMLAQDREMMASIYPPQPTPTKAEP